MKKGNQNKRKGENKLETVTNNMNMGTSQAYNALDNVVIFYIVLENFNITNDTLIKVVCKKIDLW